MSARLLYWPALVAATLVLAGGLMKGFALLQYMPGVGDAVFGAAHLCGVHGDEGVDDFYAAVSGIVSVAIALSAAALLHRRRARTMLRR